MKIFFLTKYYNQYLNYFEEKNFHLNKLNFKKHQEVLFNDHFSWPSDFSQYLSNKGLNTFFSIANYSKLQQKWLKDNKIYLSQKNNLEKRIVVEQIKKFRPDILWIFAIFDYYDEFLNEIKPYTKKIVSWISSPYSKKLSFKNIDYLITSDEGLFINKKNEFKKIITTLPGFNENILNKIKKIQKKNTYPKIGFNGQFTIDHKIRVKYISELLNNNYNINITGLVTQNPLKDIIKKYIFLFSNFNFKSKKDLSNSFNEFKEFYLNTNFLRKQKIKPLFGMDYYNFINDCDIIINVHSDDSKNYGGAQRIVEVTGIGSCLITEKKIDTLKQYKLNEEIVGYSSFSELLNLLYKMNNNKLDFKKVGLNGQNRTLNDYLIENMYENVKEIFE